MVDRDVPAGIDVNTPNSARMYDYFLGGKDNFAVDRQIGDEVIAALPSVPCSARENRAFLRRAVRFCVEEAGIRQFLDIGAGLPTQENVHQVAQKAAPDAKVVYIDHDPVVVAHARMLLDGVSGTAIIQADLREPEEMLSHPEFRELIDLDEPVALLLVAVLHFVRDEEDPFGLVARYRNALAGGSHLVISHATADTLRPEDADSGQQVSIRGRHEFAFRSHDEVLRLFEGCELVEPGLVHLPAWRPDEGMRAPESEAIAYGGVARM